MRNFDYIKDLGLFELHRFCAAAEENQICNPDICAINSRKALEYVVKALYNMKNIEVSERTSLFELIDAEPFKDFINDYKVMMAVHYVRKIGNITAILENKKNTVKQVISNETSKLVRYTLESVVANGTGNVLFATSPFSDYPGYVPVTFDERFDNAKTLRM